jgi:hypothetical protein
MGTDDPFRFDAGDEGYALSHAYVPEHIPGLMASISRAAPFLIENYLGFARDNWVIFVGYPLGARFDGTHCGALIARILEWRRPAYLWFIGPEIPTSLAPLCRARQSDQYFRLDLAHGILKASLQREVNQAVKQLTVEHARTFTGEHQSLVDELLQREELPPMVVALYRAMPDYLGRCETARLLDARNARGQLTAFFVIEAAAEQFDTHVLGCHSKKNYAPHASDLLFAEMIRLARERGKPTINLGLGVNAGIRRFKTKWGGKPYLQYEFCECHFGPPKRFAILDLFWGRPPQVCQ